MKKLFVIVLVLFALKSNAQSIPCTEAKVDTAKFLVSSIIAVKAPDCDDLKFVEASVKEELIRSDKIRMSEAGDTLFVTLLSQHPKVANSSYGRDGKYGELSISIVSKNGRAAATARGYIGVNDGWQYYLALQTISEGAAERFSFTK